MKYTKIQQRWESIGSPIIAEKVIVCDGAKILGPVVIGGNSVVATGVRLHIFPKSLQLKKLRVPIWKLESA